MRAAPGSGAGTFAHMHLVTAYLAEPAGCGATGLSQRLAAAEAGFDVQISQPRGFAGRAFDAVRVDDAIAEHLIAGADAQHLAAAPQINVYNGRRTVQLKVLDWRPAGGEADRE